MFGKGSLGPLLLKFGSQTSSISITRELVRNTDLWALSQSHLIRISLSVRSPVPSLTQAGPEAYRLRPTDHSCQILAQESMYVGSKVFYFLPAL